MINHNTYNIAYQYVFAQAYADMPLTTDKVT